MPPNNQQPNNPAPTGQFDSSQFDFIMNSGQNQKKSLVTLPSDPKKKLIFLVLGGSIGLVFIILLFSLIFGGSSGPVESLVSVAQQQNEIVRISGEAERNVSSAEAKKLVTMVATVIETDQKNTVEYMANNGRKIDKKELALKQDANVDQQLENAQQNGQLDETYIQITLEYLQKYQENMNSIFTGLGYSDQVGGNLSVPEEGQTNIEKLLRKNRQNVSLILQDSQSSLQ